MKICKLASSLFVGATLTAAAFAQQPAPAVQSSGSGWSIGLSYDYYTFREEWGGAQAAIAYWGAGNVFSPPGKISGTREGGTVSLGKSKFAIDFSYLEGHKSILLPNRIGTITFEDRVKFSDEIIDVRFRYNFTRGFYMAAGYYQQDTEQTYSFVTLTPVATARAAVPALSGTLGNKYVTLGAGLAQQVSLSPTWFLAFKEEATALVGSADTQTSTVAATRFASSSETVWGARATLSARLSWVVSSSTTLALEGGGEYRTFFNGGNTNGDKSLGGFGRAAIKFNF